MSENSPKLDLQMSVRELLRKKRDGEELKNEEIEYFVRELVSGRVDDSQIGAMLMAMYIRGLSNSETAELTRCMVASGEQMQWEGMMVDKHSTGGVGDKISLVLAPVLAACGLKVPMVSGRSLEHTGGTLDKLESIPGFIVDLNREMMEKALDHAGCFIAAATSHLCPADKLLYRARDTTSTVDCINLIVPSILSKKAASGVKYLVLDVKVGRAAFCKTVDVARALAKQLDQLTQPMCPHWSVVCRASCQMDVLELLCPDWWLIFNISADVGVLVLVLLQCYVLGIPPEDKIRFQITVSEKLGMHSRVVLSRMDEPLGNSAGNSLEVAEVVQCLSGNMPPDIDQLVRVLATNLLEMTKYNDNPEKLISEVIENGSAKERFCRMLRLQGVKEETVQQLMSGKTVLPRAKYITQLKAQSSGWVSEVDAWVVGQVCLFLGAGRSSSADVIDPAVGVVVSKHVGDRVSEGEEWITVHHSTPELSPQVMTYLSNAIKIVPTVVHKPKIVIEVIQRLSYY